MKAKSNENSQKQKHENIFFYVGWRNHVKLLEAQKSDISHYLSRRAEKKKVEMENKLRTTKITLF